MKRIVFVMLMMICVTGMLFAQDSTLPLRPSNWGQEGAGTALTPYLISSLANLRWLSERSSDWWVDATTHVHFRQTADIDATETATWNSGSGFRPIGHSAAGERFVGVYDGGYFTISNLFSNQRLNNISRAGLFNIISGNSIVKNLRIENCTIIAQNSSSTNGGFGHSHAGAVASVIQNSSIVNVTSSGTITANAGTSGSSRTEAHPRAGGLVGWAEQGAVIKFSYSLADVIVGTWNTSSLNHNLSPSAGGIAGYAQNTTIINSYSRGNITASRVTPSVGIASAGGILGRIGEGSYVTIELCYATGERTSRDNNGGIVGSIGGQNRIINNFWDRGLTGTVGTDRAFGNATPAQNGTNIGLNTQNMQTASTYIGAGWNFQAIWGMNSMLNHGYPHLRHFYMEVSLISPIDTATLLPLRPALRWSRPAGGVVAGYHIYLGTSTNPYDSNNPSTNRVETINDATTISWFPTSYLDPNTIYHWQVVAFGTNIVGNPSPSWSFTTANIGTPRLNRPEDISVQNVLPLFMWYRPVDVAVVSGYWLYIATELDSVGKIFDANNPEENRAVVIASEFTTNWLLPVEKVLNHSTRYYWQIVAVNNDEVIGPSTVWSFRTIRPEDDTGLVAYTNDPMRGPSLVRTYLDHTGTIMIEWERPLGADPTGYRVWHRTQYTTATPLTEIGQLSSRARRFEVPPHDLPFYNVFGVQALYDFEISTHEMSGHTYGSDISTGTAVSIGGWASTGMEAGTSGPVHAVVSMEFGINWGVEKSLVTTLSQSNFTESGISITTAGDPSGINETLFINRGAAIPQNLIILPPSLDDMNTGTVRLAWQPPSDVSLHARSVHVVGYNIYQDGFERPIQTVSGTVFSFIDNSSNSNMIAGNRYTYWVTSLLSDGTESNPSNEVWVHPVGGRRPYGLFPGSGQIAGSAANPFNVHLPGHLQWLSEYSARSVNHSGDVYIGWHTNPATRIYIRQTDHIDMSATRYWNPVNGTVHGNHLGFIPIGHNAAPSIRHFHGVYDAGRRCEDTGSIIGNYEIRNLFINSRELGLYPVGLFSTVGKGRRLGSACGTLGDGIPTDLSSVIRNLTLRNPIIYGNAIVGGIVGVLEEGSEIIDCHVIGGTIFGYSSVGGIAGIVASNSTIRNSSTSTKIVGNVAGGIAGSLNSSTVRDSYSSSTIHGGYSGGIAGLTMNSRIVNTYVYGHLDFGASRSSGIGGPIAGSAIMINNPDFQNIVQNNFWINDTGYMSFDEGFGFIPSTFTAANTVGRTIAQMRDVANFAGWENFNNNWAIDPDRNWGFPHLRTQSEVLITNRATDLSGVFINGEVILSWNAPIGSTGTVEIYNIFRNGILIGSTAGLTFTDEDVEIGVEYTYAITVVYANPSGETPPTDTISITPLLSDFSIEPLSHDFGSITVGGVSNSHTFVITNTGARGTIQNILITGTNVDDFALTNLHTLPMELDTEETIEVSVAFSPTSEGERTAFLTVVDDSEVNSSIMLSGIGVEELSGDDIVETPIMTALLGNFPNPFNPETTIRFALREDSFVSIDIYNIRGQRIRSLVNEERRAGEYSIVWNGRDDNGNSVASGMYFYRMKAGEYQSIRRMMMIK